MSTGQQRNSLQGENDNASEEVEGVLQPETGTTDWKLVVAAESVLVIDRLSAGPIIHANIRNFFVYRHQYFLDRCADVNEFI